MLGIAEDYHTVSNGRISESKTQLRSSSVADPRVYMACHGLLRPIAPEAADAYRIFAPPYPTSPNDLYVATKLNSYSILGYRYVCSTDSTEMLIFVDGSAFNNGSPSSRAGYGIVFAPIWSSESTFSGRLEQDGNPQTSNRAELRAALAALTLRSWGKEGFSSIVIACDSEYVVKGISKWIFKWRENGWKTASGHPVINQDLWNKLEAKLRDVEEQGMLVRFWQIPREWNEADKYAKIGAVIIFFRSPFFFGHNEEHLL